MASSPPPPLFAPRRLSSGSNISNGSGLPRVGNSSNHGKRFSSPLPMGAVASAMPFASHAVAPTQQQQQHHHHHQHQQQQQQQQQDTSPQAAIPAPTAAFADTAAPAASAMSAALATTTTTTTTTMTSALHRRSPVSQRLAGSAAGKPMRRAVSVPNLESRGDDFVPSSEGSASDLDSEEPSPSSLAKKRHRTTPEQLAALEEMFARNMIPNSQTREALAENINMSPRSVLIWFQNRRAKLKNERKKNITAPEQLFPFSLSDPSFSTPTSSLMGPPYPSSAHSVQQYHGSPPHGSPGFPSGSSPYDTDNRSRSTSFEGLSDLAAHGTSSVPFDHSFTSSLLRSQLYTGSAASTGTHDSTISPQAAQQWLQHHHQQQQHHHHQTHPIHRFTTSRSSGSLISPHQSAYFPNPTMRVIFEAERLKIGTWTRVTLGHGDLVCKFDGTLRTMAWEIVESPHRCKIEFSFDNVAHIQMHLTNELPGVMYIHLLRPPEFYLEVKVQENRSAWRACNDITEGHQATKESRHVIQASRSVLTKQLPRLFENDPHLRLVTQIQDDTLLKSTGDLDQTNATGQAHIDIRSMRKSHSTPILPNNSSSNSSTTKGAYIKSPLSPREGDLKFSAVSMHESQSLDGHMTDSLHRLGAQTNESYGTSTYYEDVSGITGPNGGRLRQNITPRPDAYAAAVDDHFNSSFASTPVPLAAETETSDALLEPMEQNNITDDSGRSQEYSLHHQLQQQCLVGHTGFDSLQYGANDTDVSIAQPGMAWSSDLSATSTFYDPSDTSGSIDAMQTHTTQFDGEQSGFRDDTVMYHDVDSLFHP